METQRQAESLHIEEAVGPLEAKTPYQHTLTGLLFPWRAHLVFNTFAGFSLALVGWPALALAWTLANCAADFVLQRLYGRWWIDAAETDSACGLRRLAVCTTLRSALWMTGPVVMAIATGEMGAYAYAALTGLSMVAIAASAGWISRGVWAGYAGPAVLGLIILAWPKLSVSEAAAVLMGAVSFLATATLIALATERSLSEWSRANDRTRAVMTWLREALSRSEAAERALMEARDRAEAGSRAKSEFLATISHEIRTPLNGVLGMAQAMEMDELPARQRDRLEVIRRSGENLHALLNSVLDLSKIEAGKLQLEDGEVDIAVLARSTVDAFAGEAAAKGVVLSLQMEPAAPGVYGGDPMRVGQILCNLLSNAVKFTEQGTVTVSIRGEEAGLELAVADTGVGISPEQQHVLFDKFAQADGSITRRYGGSGLGLAICKELVNLMGGAISVESEPGRGSVFTVTLPLPRIVTPARAAVREETAEPAVRELRVLAVEDNEVNQLVLTTLLSQLGIEPGLVCDGQQAVAACEAQDWDLILMDVQMPVMDGVTATRLIRAREAHLRLPRTPIVALTANVLAHQVEIYREAGMDDVVPKPINAGALLRAIDHAIAGREAPAEIPPTAAHG